MPQTVVHYSAHMIGRDELMAVQPSPHARTAVERQAAARTGTDLYPIAERLAVAVREARGIDHVNHVLLRQFGHEDTVDLRARLENGLLGYRVAVQPHASLAFARSRHG